MPIQVTCPNDACGKTFAVKDEYAGRKAKCPACGGVLTIPNGAVVAPPPMRASAPPPRPTRRDEEDDYDDEPPRRRSAPPAGGGLFAALGLQGLSQILFFVGAGCLLLSIIAVFLPWATLPSTITGPGGKSVSLEGLQTLGLKTSSSGIEAPAGVIQLILSLGVGIFAGVAFGMKNRMLFNISIYVAAAWGIIGLLMRILTLLTLNSGIPPMMGDMLKLSPGIGLWIAIISLLGVAGTFGFIAILNLMGGKKAPARPRRPQPEYEDEYEDER
jgi:hypothetical protein